MLTTTTIESLLALTAMVCAVVSAYSLSGSVLRLRAFARDGMNGLRMLHAKSNVVRDAIRLASAVVLAVASVVLLQLPPDEDPAALVSKHALVVVGWCLLANVVYDARSRKRIMRVISACEDSR